MAKQSINLGTAENDGTGDRLRAAGLKINANTDELYAGVASLSGIAVGLAPNVQSGTAYTAQLTDAVPAPVPVEMTSASANTFTIPPRSSVLFPVGCVLMVRRAGTGVTTIAPGSGVTIRKSASVLTLRAQWSGATLTQRAADEWVADGDFA
jgi:hypothetical protein